MDDIGPQDGASTHPVVGKFTRLDLIGEKSMRRSHRRRIIGIPRQLAAKARGPLAL